MEAHAAANLHSWSVDFWSLKIANNRMMLAIVALSNRLVLFLEIRQRLLTIYPS